MRQWQGLRGLTSILKEVLLWVKCYQTALHATNCLWWKSQLIFIFQNCISHTSLQQPPPSLISRHQHWGKTLHQQKDYDHWSLRWWLAIFLTNQLLFNQLLFKICTLFLKKHNALTHLIDYSIVVNITFICTRKPKSSCDSFYCDICFIVMV